MIDADKYEGALYRLTDFLESNEQYGDDWSEEKKVLNDLLAEVKRLRYIVDSIPDDVWKEMRTWEAMKEVIE